MTREAATVTLEGELSRQQLEGIAKHLEAVRRLGEWMAGRGPPLQVRQARVEGRKILLPVATSVPLLWEGSGLAASIWWARVVRVHLEP